jgi:hypothetical protein
MRHTAEKSSRKTIKVFHSMWKRHCEKRKPVKDTGTKAKPKKRSMLHRAVRKIFKRK